MNFMGMKLSSNSYQLAMSFTMKLNVYESIESGCFNHSHKVSGSTGSRNGVEGRGSSFYKIVVRRGYTSMER